MRRDALTGGAVKAAPPLHVDKLKAVSLRLPLKLYERIEDTAGRHRRSVNQEIVFALESYLREVVK